MTVRARPIDAFMTTATFTSNKFSGLGIRGKLIGLVLALAAVSGVCLAVAVSGLLNARTKSHQSQATFKVFQTARDAYEGWLTDDDQSNMYAATIALRDPRQNQLAETTWQQALAGYRQANAKLAWLSANAANATVRSMVATLRSDLSSYNGFTQQVGRYGHHGDPVAAVRVVTVTNANISNQTQADFDKLSSVLTKQAAAIDASVGANVSSSISLLSVIGVVGLIIAIAITVWLIRSITKPLALMTESAERIAEGDVDVEVNATSNDEIGRLAHAFNASIDYLKHMVDAAGQMAAGNLAVDVKPRSERDALGRAFSDMREKIAGMIGEISKGSDTVSTASQEMAQSGQQAGLAVGEIANAVGSVAQGAETQVRALERIRGLTTDVATAAQNSAADAEETAEAARQARELAGEGAEVVTRATEAIQAVQASTAEITATISELGAMSDQIGGIVDTITAIAEQTNLLALNAAIEAARACEPAALLARSGGLDGRVQRQQVGLLGDRGDRVDDPADLVAHGAQL